MSRVVAKIGRQWLTDIPECHSLLPCQGGHIHPLPGPWQSPKRYPATLCHFMVDVDIKLAGERGIASLAAQRRVAHSAKMALAVTGRRQRRGRASQTHVQEYSELVEIVVPAGPAHPATDSKRCFLRGLAQSLLVASCCGLGGLMVVTRA
eukprot:5238298-Amphidinium_carterae.1